MKSVLLDISCFLVTEICMYIACRKIVRYEHVYSPCRQKHRKKYTKDGIQIYTKATKYTEKIKQKKTIDQLCEAVRGAFVLIIAYISRYLQSYVLCSCTLKQVGLSRESFAWQMNESEILIFKTC